MKSRMFDALYASMITIICVLLFIETQSDKYQETGIGFSNNAIFYPRILIAILVVLSIAMFLESMLPGRAIPEEEEKKALIPVYIVIALSAVFAGVFSLFPFLITSIPFVFCLGIMLGYRRYQYLLITSISLPLIVSFTFENILGIPLP